MIKNLESISEEDIIILMRERDEKAFTILYNNYYLSLYGVIYRIIKEKEVAENVLQETFVKIWRDFSSYKTDKGRLFTWMISIARNLAIDHLRSKTFRNNKKTFNIDVTTRLIDSKNNLSFNSDGIGIKEMVFGLKPAYIDVIDMLYFKGYTHTQTANRLNIPLGTVKTRVKKAIQILKETMS